MKIYIKRIKIINILIFCFFVENAFGMDQELKNINFDELFSPSVDNYTLAIQKIAQRTKALDAKLEKISYCSLLYKACLKDTEPEYMLVMGRIDFLNQPMPLVLWVKKSKNEAVQKQHINDIVKILDLNEVEEHRWTEDVSIVMAKVTMEFLAQSRVEEKENRKYNRSGSDKSTPIIRLAFNYIKASPTVQIVGGLAILFLSMHIWFAYIHAR